MRFATLEATVEGTLLGLEAFVGAQGLDLLNLRYRRARVVPPTGDNWTYPEFNQAFVTHLGQLTKSLYLEPNLHVFADAGWGNAYGCVEAAAAKLVDAGCGDLLISAVRGSNLLPMLDQLYFEGHRFKHEATGEPFDVEGHKLLAADLQIGAGPIEAAFAEGARVIVAGCCDCAAGVIAKSAAQYQWQWDELDNIASAAAAAELTRELSHRQPFTTEGPISAVVGSVDPEGGFTVGVDAEELPNLAARSLLSVADVHGEWSGVSNSVVSPGITSIAGMAGGASDGTWRLNLTYVRYGSTSLLAFETADLAEEFMRHLPAEIPKPTSNTAASTAGCFYHTLPQDEESSSCRLLVRIVSNDATKCGHWSSLVEQKVAQAGPQVEWLSRPPQVEALAQIWPTRIPRDQIDIAVDTRPAKEWY